MLNNNRAVAKAIGAIALTASAMAASTALAGAKGNTVDADGCEWNTVLNHGNHCNTGTSSPRIALHHGLDSFMVSSASSATAYAALFCNDGSLERGSVGGQPLQYKYCASGGRPRLSVCGENPVCKDKGS